MHITIIILGLAWYNLLFSTYAPKNTTLHRSTILTSELYMFVCCCFFTLSRLQPMGVLRNVKVELCTGHQEFLCMVMLLADVCKGE